MPWLRRLLVAVLLAAVLPSCVSEADLRREWADYVITASDCSADAECTLVSPGCPLGCYDTVNVESVDEAMAEADRLVGTYEGAGRSCEYDCPDAPPIACVEGRCTLE